MPLLPLLITTATIATTATPPQPAPEAAATPAAEETIESVVITARRRSEASKDVPLAISVVSGELVENTGAFNVGRLQQLTPTLNFYSSNPRNTAINIRGIGVPFGLTNDGFDQGVGLYIDDVYYARVAAATFDFLDVDRIEVLRGPQGSLYGKNTTAGAVNVTTRAPTPDFEARAELSAGNLAFRQARGALSGPLSETLSGRLALSWTSREGTLANVATRRRNNELGNLGVRGQLLWQPRDGTDVMFAADFSTQDPECCAQVYVRTGATQRPLNRQYAALAAAQNYTVASTDPFARITDFDASLNAGNTLGGASVRVRTRLGAGELTSVSAWRYWDWQPENDRDFTGLPITTLSQNPTQQDQYTQEFRYAVSTPSLDVLVGAFAFRQKVRTQGTQRQGPAASRWLIAPSSPLASDPRVLDGLTATNDIRLDNTSAALFGQATWKLSKRFDLQPGLRINYDSKEGLYDSVVRDAAGNLVQFGQPGAVRAAQLAVLSPQRFEPEFSDWNFSGDLTARWLISTAATAYATYARAYKSGGINLNGVPNDAAGNPLLAAGTVDPESVDHVELGLKTEFWGGSATLNLAAFRSDIADYQALVVNGQIGVLRGYLANAEAVRTQGVEVDFAVRPANWINAYLNAAWVDGTYRRFRDAPCPPELSGGGTGATIAAPGTPGNSPANCDISGQRLPGVSEWALSAGAEASVPFAALGSSGEAFVAVDGNYRSRFSSNPSPSSYTWVDGYTLANVRAGYRSDGGLEAFAWVRNAFDERYFEQLSVPSGNTGLIVGQPGDPRTWGLTIRVRF
jgi:iron complex outermembrane receptor protein